MRQLGKAVPKNGGTEASDDQLPFLGQSLWGVLGAGHTLEEKQSEDSRKLAHTSISLLELNVFILPPTGLNGPLKEFSMGDLVD